MAKTDAERAKQYRDRKRATRVNPSHEDEFRRKLGQLLDTYMQLMGPDRLYRCWSEPVEEGHIFDLPGRIKVEMWRRTTEGKATERERERRTEKNDPLENGRLLAELMRELGGS